MSDLSQQVRSLSYTFSHHLRLAVICYFTTVDFMDIELINDMQPGHADTWQQ